MSRRKRRVAPRVVVVGAGYAGLAAAKGLVRRAPRDVDVVVINRSDRFVERVRLHQVAAGQSVPAMPISGVRLELGEVTGLDLRRRCVQVEDREVGFDRLVYALGSVGDLDRVRGARAHAVPVGCPAGAQRVAARLAALTVGQRVIVVGGGLTGIETAAEIAEASSGLDVELVSARLVGGWLHPKARDHVLQGLRRLGVRVREGMVVSRVEGGGVVTSQAAVAADLVVWAAGFAVSPLAAEAGLAVDPQGRVLVDERLRSQSHPHVYAVGDAASATAGGQPTRMSCQTGLPMGSYAAAAISADLRGQRTSPFRMRYVWQNISLGRGDGVTQFTRFDDTPRRAVLTGKAAARFKELITRSAAWAATR